MMRSFQNSKINQLESNRIVKASESVKPLQSKVPPTVHFQTYILVDEKIIQHKPTIFINNLIYQLH